MFTKTVEVVNETGLHARPASKLVEVSNTFKSDIKLVGEGVDVNCKSIISVLTGGIQKGTILELQVSGEDEEQAGEAIAELIANMEG